jgi:hypothetical protein
MESIWKEIGRLFNRWDIHADTTSAVRALDTNPGSKATLGYSLEEAIGTKRMAFNIGRHGDFQVNADVRCRMIIGGQLVEEFEVSRNEPRFPLWGCHPINVMGLTYSSIILEVDQPDVRLKCIWALLHTPERRELASRPCVTEWDGSRGQLLMSRGIAGVLTETSYSGDEALLLPDLQEYVTVVPDPHRRQRAIERCEKIREELIVKTWHPSRLSSCLDWKELSELKKLKQKCIVEEHINLM